MEYLVSLSARARRDLAQIYEYINATDSHSAQNWYRGLRDAILGLEQQPNRWPVTHESGKFRHILYGNKPHIYRIIYRVLERQKRVEVIHIRHGARDHFS